MADDLLRYYNRELIHIRRLAGEFAAANPKIAGRLRLSAEAVDDPHVARLIEAFAYLNARLRLKLDDDFPELTDALLEILYPHYLAPIPSLAIGRFVPADDHADPVSVPRGTLLESEPVGGEACRFRTCYAVELPPVSVTAARLTGLPLVAPPNPQARGAAATLRLTLDMRVAGASFAATGLDRLRVYLAGPSSLANQLYELLFTETVSVALADGAGDPAPVLLGADALQPVGFAEEEGLLDYPARSLPGYRLLSEVFALPEKFLFVDLVGLAAKTAALEAGRFEIFVYLKRGSAELERSVDAAAFQLGCTPIVNLFAQRAEPIDLDRRLPDYPVVPDARRPNATEVVAVRSVTGTSPTGDVRHFRPFYALGHDDAGSEGREAFWFAARRAAGGRRAGTEMALSLVDLDFDPNVPSDWVLSVETTCCNRDLPASLPFGGGHPHLAPVTAVAGIAAVSCLTAPTETLRMDQGDGGRWRLISHLSLNHLSLTNDGAGIEAFREILRLYDYRDSPETRAMIDAVTAVSHRATLARAPGHPYGAFCRGLEIAMEFDPDGFSGGGLFVLAQVLERFVALYGSINGFTRFVATVKGRPGVLKAWPPRAGDRPLL